MKSSRPGWTFEEAELGGGKGCSSQLIDKVISIPGSGKAGPLILVLSTSKVVLKRLLLLACTYEWRSYIHPSRNRFS